MTANSFCFPHRIRKFYKVTSHNQIKKNPEDIGSTNPGLKGRLIDNLYTHFSSEFVHLVKTQRPKNHTLSLFRSAAHTRLGQVREPPLVFLQIYPTCLCMSNRKYPLEGSAWVMYESYDSVHQHVTSHMMRLMCPRVMVLVQYLRTAQHSSSFQLLSLADTTILNKLDGNFYPLLPTSRHFSQL